MALFDSEDPAADFLSREQDIIGDVISTDQFEVINQSESMPMSEAEPLDFVPSDELVTDGALETEAVQDNDNIYAAMREASEPESIRKWKEEQAEEIAARDADSEVQKEEWKAAAKQELEDWYARQNDVLDKNKTGNREAQEDFLKDQSESKPGQQWEKICKLCDFNPKSNRNSKDTSRMRGLFLQLKQTPLVR